MAQQTYTQDLGDTLSLEEKQLICQPKMATPLKPAPELEEDGFRPPCSGGTNTVEGSKGGICHMYSRPPPGHHRMKNKCWKISTLKSNPLNKSQ